MARKGEDDVLALVAKLAGRFAKLRSDLNTLARLPGPKGEDGRDGRDGRDGVDGLAGPAGAPGATGPAGPRGPAGPQGPKGDKGDKGDAGRDGRDGAEGKAPDHEWKGTKLRFRKPDGEWGRLVELRGPQGERGPKGAGAVFSGGSGSGSLDLSALPIATPDYPDHIVVYQNGAPVRATMAQLQKWLAPTTRIAVGSQSVTVLGADVTLQIERDAT